MSGTSTRSGVVRRDLRATACDEDRDRKTQSDGSKLRHLWLRIERLRTLRLKDFFGAFRNVPSWFPWATLSELRRSISAKRRAVSTDCAWAVLVIEALPFGYVLRPAVPRRRSNPTLDSIADCRTARTSTPALPPNRTSPGSPTNDCSSPLDSSCCAARHPCLAAATLHEQRYRNRRCVSRAEKRTRCHS